MQFYDGQIFHIYNQGNNREKIFYTEDNYVYFLKKIRTYILPHADILAYCLMPNHFHILVYVHSLEIKMPGNKCRSLNESIGIMLRSYTIAINKQEQRSGSLFRQNTKIEDGWIDDAITLNGKYKKYLFASDQSYGRVCFEYIHENPVKAKLAKKQEDWMFSSAIDYKGLRNGTLCNQALTKILLG
ncbi:MAG: hypothetical protein H7X99_03160 [Saprospiraceae bacterium]|nr:hypothetical protein [Saprospiraceae bacterium]